MSWLEDAIAEQKREDRAAMIAAGLASVAYGVVVVIAVVMDSVPAVYVGLGLMAIPVGLLGSEAGRVIHRWRVNRNALG